MYSRFFLIKMKTNGFTLIETIVAISIFTMIAAGTAALFKEVLSGSSQRRLSMNNVDQARVLEFTFANELRNAVTGNDGSYPLNEAEDTEIIFYSSYRAPSGIANRIRYYYSANTLYKGVVVPTGSPLSYNLNSETIYEVQNDVVNTPGVPIFYYYDDNYGGTTTPLSQPVNINQVKFAKLHLFILNQDVRSSTTTFPVSAGATIRALKTNLGS
jgi:prepilin-type N-terminal cleavage/methylation domain-containing protein